MQVEQKSKARRLPAIWAAALSAVLAASAVSPARAVPSYARQTGMTCSACHTVFPELTPFGREFKLNGYVIDNMRQIKGQNMERRETLSLNAIPPLSLMLQVSYTHTSSPLPDAGPAAATGVLAKDGEVLFPQQLSFFYAGKIADNLGSFVQITYDGAEDHFGLDNTDIRYARYLGNAEPADEGSGQAHAKKSGSWFANHDLLFGVTLNNNPTVQDPWNSTPAWGYPYAASSVAPGPIAATQIDGALGGTVAGLGAYVWYDHSFYAEISGYTAAYSGGDHPLDSSQTNVVKGVAPYWRIGYEHDWERNSLFVGTYGIQASIWPGNPYALSGPTNKYTDFAGDVQYQFIGDEHMVSFIGTYIRENQTLDASYAEGNSTSTSGNLHTTKLTGEYYYRRTIGGSLGFFATNGTSNALLYPNDQSVGGDLTGSPNSRGYIVEVDYLPFLNVKLSAQYVAYNDFNGSSSNYNGVYRSASDNNTMYLLVWLNY